jgi:hypothetical protein
MVSRATQRAVRWRAIRRRRASIAWTRETLTDSLDTILTNAFLAFLKARLAQRHAGLRRHEQRWSAELHEQLDALSSALTHPVHPSVDRVVVFEEAVERMVEHEGALCGEVMAIARGHHAGPLRRPLEAADVEAFWREVRAEW